MSCYHPVTAYQSADGSVSFAELRRNDPVKTLQLPCGKCVGCRLERSRQWAVRCLHEAQVHEVNCFVTLTYRDGCLPPGGNLVYRDFQLFMKRLRARSGRKRIRFYMCGEYGERERRPHFHALLFGFDFSDKVFLRRSPAGEPLFRSPLLESIWTSGFSSIGAVTAKSAAYVCRYVMKKAIGVTEVVEKLVNPVNGEVLNPEFNHMSLGGRAAEGGIGAKWLERYSSDVYPSGKVVVQGVQCKAPRYYDRWLSKFDPETFAFVQCDRERVARARYLDDTSDRLAVREQVAEARLRHLKRSI